MRFLDVRKRQYSFIGHSESNSKKNHINQYITIFVAIAIIIYTVLSLNKYINLKSSLTLIDPPFHPSCTRLSLTQSSQLLPKYRKFSLNIDQNMKLKKEVQQLINMNERNQNISKITDKRILFGQPDLNNKEKLKIWIIENKGENMKQYCTIVNALNIITKNTIQSLKSLFANSEIKKAILITLHDDKFSENLLREYFSEGVLAYQLVQFDSDYDFIRNFSHTCTKIIYTFSNFLIEPEMAYHLHEEMKKMNPLTALYSSRIVIESKIEQLPNLKQTDLLSIKPQQFYSYLYIFDSVFLTFITPLNFAYYSRYTLQQAIILPILSIVQENENALISIENVVHSVKQVQEHLIRHDFRVYPPEKQVNSICFVSYPNNPFEIDEKQFYKYFNSILDQEETDKQKLLSISAIVYFPYKFGKSSSLLSILNKILNEPKTQLPKIKRIKLRILSNKTVSSYAVYDAVYGYCPNQTMVVSSRHNAQFGEIFSRQILDNIQEQYHFYYVNSQNFMGTVTKFIQLPNNLKVSIRKSEFLFEQHFQNYQIFKSDLMKTSLFYVLKCAQLDFYETQAPFVFIMLEQTRLKFKYINKTLIYVGTRDKTALELHQIKYVKSYAQYNGLKDNKLMPYPYSCLENKAYMRFAPDRIERKIHQIWLSKDKISPVRVKLHQTIVNKNKNLEVKLWRFENITRNNFPLTYDMVQRVLEYHKTAEKSFFTLAADLLRYEIVYRQGGIYIDFKMQALKPMDDYLKYEVFFLDCDISELRFGRPKVIGIGIFGAVKNSYYLKTILNELILWENFDFIKRIPIVSGSFIARSAFNQQQFFTVLGLGFQLLYPLPYEPLVNACGGVDKKFDRDQQVFSIYDYHAQVDVKIGIPCKQYPQSYLVSYAPLAKTWVYQKRQIN